MQNIDPVINFWKLKIQGFFKIMLSAMETVSIFLRFGKINDNNNYHNILVFCLLFTYLTVMICKVREKIEEVVWEPLKICFQSDSAQDLRKNGEKSFLPYIWLGVKAQKAIFDPTLMTSRI